MTSASASGATQREASAAGIAARLSGVSRTVGSTQLTRTAWSRSSAAMASVRRCTAAFDAA